MDALTGRMAMQSKKSPKKGKITIKDLDLAKKSGDKTKKDPRGGDVYAVARRVR
jgi:hypothetical protein